MIIRGVMISKRINKSLLTIDNISRSKQQSSENEDKYEVETSKAFESTLNESQGGSSCKIQLKMLHVPKLFLITLPVNNHFWYTSLACI